MSKRKQMVWALFCLVCCVAFGVFPARAATGVKELCRNVSKKVTVSADVTGNGKKDKIRLEFTEQPYNGWIGETRVYINGKKALSIKDSSYYYKVSLRHIRMSKSKVFLQIMSYSDNSYHTFNRIYQYDKKKKKLVTALDLKKSQLDSAEDVVKATSKNIQVRHSLQPAETGRIHWDFTYTYKNGKFKLKSSTASAKSSLGKLMPGYEDGYGKYFKKSQYVAAKELVFFTSTNLAKEAFRVKRNDKVTLKKIKVSGKTVYLQFQKGKKTGWQMVQRSNVYNYRSPDPGSTGWFFGVYKRLAG